MRGAVSAGMGVVLEAAGLTGEFDRIYGVSAGALNGCALAVGQAALSTTHYQDATSRGVINRMRPLVGQSVIDFELLFEQLIAARKPLSFDGLASGPEFRAQATSLETLSLRVLAGFADIGELMRAVRASASLPRLGGEPPVFRGERMVDGGLIEPIPVETALREGATHVLVLRSRPAGYRQPTLRSLDESFTLRDEPGLVELLRARPRVYNRQAEELQQGVSEDRRGAHDCRSRFRTTRAWSADWRATPSASPTRSGLTDRPSLPVRHECEGDGRRTWSGDNPLRLLLHRPIRHSLSIR